MKAVNATMRVIRVGLSESVIEVQGVSVDERDDGDDLQSASIFLVFEASTKEKFKIGDHLAVNVKSTAAPKPKKVEAEE